MQVKPILENPILVIDGLNLFIRSFVVNEAVNAAGELVGGTLGFMRSLRNLVRQYKPTKVFVVWEQGGPSPRRKHIFPEYKANRAKTKEFQELYRRDGRINAMADSENKAKQLVMLTKALGFLPICQLYVQGVEADDVIAWLVKHRFRDHAGTRLVVSNDKDFYQLLEDPGVRIHDPATKLLISGDTVLERFGIAPRNITLARAVVGDPSDNIDGVEGIGLKTVANRFGELADATRDFDVAWLTEQCAIRAKASKKAPRCFGDVLANEAKIRRNWQLMYLDNSAMAASQIEKLEYRITEFVPAINYLSYVKVFTGNDIALTEDLGQLPADMRFLI